MNDGKELKNGDIMFWISQYDVANWTRHLVFSINLFFIDFYWRVNVFMADGRTFANRKVLSEIYRMLSQFWYFSTRTRLVPYPYWIYDFYGVTDFEQNCEKFWIFTPPIRIQWVEIKIEFQSNENQMFTINAIGNL